MKVPEKSIIGIDKFTEIERANRLLLERLTNIMHTQHDPSVAGIGREENLR